jgi:hypothetical protein
MNSLSRKKKLCNEVYFFKRMFSAYGHKKRIGLMANENDATKMINSGLIHVLAPEAQRVAT